MNEPRPLRPMTIEGSLRFVPVEEWAERHRRAGHHPQPTPTTENPERWDCDCGRLWRIPTPEQIKKKFAHLKRANEGRAGSSARHRVHHGMWTQIPVESLPELA